MDASEQRFIQFWEKYGTNRWKFVSVTGGIFGVFMIVIFAWRAILTSSNIDSVGAYFQSDLFWLHVIFLGVFSGLIYGLLMFRFFKRSYEKIKKKYNE